jgi:GNAT superfamily N-acetyltransferase
MIQIRQGKIADFKKLKQKWAWSPENDWQQVAQKEYIKGIEEGTQEFWVIENGKEILGEFHVFWNKNSDPEQADGKSRAYLSAFRVHPDHRGKGLGTKLMERVIERIKEKAFNEVTIGAYKHDLEIQKLYEKWGFTEFVKEAVDVFTEGKPSYLLFMKRL